MPGSSSSQCKQIDEVTQQIALYNYYVVDVLALVNRSPSKRVEMAFKPVVPNYFGAMGQFVEDNFFHTRGGGVREDMRQSSGGNAKEDLTSCPLLTFCCVASS